MPMYNLKIKKPYSIEMVYDIKWSFKYLENTENFKIENKKCLCTRFST